MGNLIPLKRNDGSTGYRVKPRVQKINTGPRSPEYDFAMGLIIGTFARRFGSAEN
jgi:hypothetical protein